MRPMVLRYQPIESALIRPEFRAAAFWSAASDMVARVSAGSRVDLAAGPDPVGAECRGVPITPGLRMNLAGM